MKAYQTPIWNHLRRIMGNENDASDLTQETFVRLYVKRHHIKPELPIKAWIYSIATHAAYDLLRKKKRLKEAFIIDSEDEEDGSTETNKAFLAYSKTEEETVGRDMERALAKLPEHYRNILLLYYREGFAYGEIADQTGLPLNTIKTHMRRAKQSLVPLLRDYFE